jgi:hypothetical protein
MTLSQYGLKMDRKWRDRVRGWTDRLIYEQPYPEHMAASHPHVSQWQASVLNVPIRKRSDDSGIISPFIHTSRLYARSPSPMLEPPEQVNLNEKRLVHSTDNDQSDILPPLQTFRAIELRFQNSDTVELPPKLTQRHFLAEAWAQFLAVSVRNGFYVGLCYSTFVPA